MDQHKAEQRRNDGRERGNDGKVGYGRIFEPGELGDIVDADAEDAHDNVTQVLRGGTKGSPWYLSIANSVRATTV